MLVLDGDPIDRSGLATAFSRAGYQVASPRDLGALLPSAIVIDWTSPLDGLELLRTQVADASLRGVPVIVLSPLGRMDAVPSLCVDAVLPKPVRMRTLLDVVDRLCDATQEGQACGR